MANFCRFLLNAQGKGERLRKNFRQFRVLRGADGTLPSLLGWIVQ
jgi:hypothetical protein